MFNLTIFCLDEIWNAVKYTLNVGNQIQNLYYSWGDRWNTLLVWAVLLFHHRQIKVYWVYITQVYWVDITGFDVYEASQVRLAALHVNKQSDHQELNRCWECKLHICLSNALVRVPIQSHSFVQVKRSLPTGCTNIRDKIGCYKRLSGK